MINLDLVLLEETFKLMDKHLIDEIQCEQFTIKRTKFRGQEKAEPTDAALLARHLAPLPQEPWMELPDEAVENWSKGMK